MSVAAKIGQAQRLYRELNLRHRYRVYDVFVLCSVSYANACQDENPSVFPMLVWCVSLEYVVIEIGDTISFTLSKRTTKCCFSDDHEYRNDVSAK